MGEYRRVRCLFCTVGKEREVVTLIRERGYGWAIFPQKVQRRLNKSTRQWDEIAWPLLPGYVFLYEAEEERIPSGELLGLRSVVKILRYGASGEEELAGRDLMFAGWLWRTNGMVGKLRVMEVGDRIEIVDSAFETLRGTIRRVDRRRQTCQVELDSEGLIRKLWLPYDMIQRLEGEDKFPRG